jgi:hypothetical protein
MGLALAGQSLQRTNVSCLLAETALVFVIPIPQMNSERPRVAIS